MNCWTLESQVKYILVGTEKFTWKIHHKHYWDTWWGRGGRVKVLRRLIHFNPSSGCNFISWTPFKQIYPHQLDYRRDVLCIVHFLRGMNGTIPSWGRVKWHFQGVEWEGVKFCGNLPLLWHVCLWLEIFHKTSFLHHDFSDFLTLFYISFCHFFRGHPTLFPPVISSPSPQWRYMKNIYFGENISKWVADVSEIIAFCWESLKL